MGRGATSEKRPKRLEPPGPGVGVSEGRGAAAADAALAALEPDHKRRLGIAVLRLK